MPVGHTFFLREFHQGHQTQGDGGDQEDDGEHLVEGECLLDPGHVHAQAAEAAQPLADDRADDAVGRGNPQSGEELRQGRGEFDVAEDLHPARAHGPEQADGVPVRAAEAVEQAHRHREEGGDDDQDDLRGHLIAEPQHQQRRDGHGGHRLGDDEQGIEGFVQDLEGVHQHRHGEAEGHAQHKAEKCLPQGDQGVLPQQGQLADEGPDHLHRAGQHIPRHQTQHGHALPDGQQCRHGDDRRQITPERAW